MASVLTHASAAIIRRDLNGRKSVYYDKCGGVLLLLSSDSDAMSVSVVFGSRKCQRFRRWLRRNIVLFSLFAFVLSAMSPNKMPDLPSTVNAMIAFVLYFSFAFRDATEMITARPICCGEDADDMGFVARIVGI